MTAFSGVYPALFQVAAGDDPVARVAERFQDVEAELPEIVGVLELAQEQVSLVRETPAQLRRVG